MTTAEAVAAIIDITSRMGMQNHREVAEALANDHRTLQQNTMNFVLEFIEFMADNYQNGRYDFRSEQAAEVANRIKEAVWDGKYPPPMPFG